MSKHYLKGLGGGWLEGLHVRACDTKILRCTLERDKRLGSFVRRDVECLRCKNTNLFKGR